jgi:hypothetical protein
MNDLVTRSKMATSSLRMSFSITGGAPGEDSCTKSGIPPTNGLNSLPSVKGPIVKQSVLKSR